MRRLLALVTLISLIGAACSSDSEAETTTTTTATTTTTTTTTATTATTETTTSAADETQPTSDTSSVFIAAGADALNSGAAVDLALPFDTEIAVSVLHVPTGPVDPDDTWQEDPGTSLREDRWMVTDPHEDGGCAFTKGQIIVSASAVDAIKDDPSLVPSSFILEDAEVFGNLAEQALALVTVPEGRETEYIQTIIEKQLGIASYHYPVAPLPRWKYGPAVPAIPIGTLPDTDAIPLDGEPVLVLDRFGPSRLTLDELLESGIPQVDAENLLETDAFITGHGEFITGILSRMGVAADEKDVVLSDDTAADEKSIAKELSASAAKVTNISMGVSPCSVDSVLIPPIGLAGAMLSRMTIDNPPTVVAAAGNHGVTSNCVPSWFPASFAEGAPAWDSYRAYLVSNNVVDSMQLDEDIETLRLTTVSVGSASLKDGSLASPERATYSACDALDGVTVWAPGTNVISDYMGNLGVWSGTSFAAPQIAGAIAMGLTIK